jgi:hypothetical protein
MLRVQNVQFIIGDKQFLRTGTLPGEARKNSVVVRDVPFT